MTWQPIETAPKDGTPIWAYAPVLTGGKNSRKLHRQVVVKWMSLERIQARASKGLIPKKQDFEKARQNDGYWGAGSGLRACAGEPTHWMPLPEPPQ